MCENVNVLSPPNKTNLLKYLTKPATFFVLFLVSCSRVSGGGLLLQGNFIHTFCSCFLICFCPLLLQRLQQRHPQSRRSRLTSALTKTISTTATTRTHSPTWMWRWPSFVSRSPPPNAVRGACLRPLCCSKKRWCCPSLLCDLCEILLLRCYINKVHQWEVKCGVIHACKGIGRDQKLLLCSVSAFRGSFE